eukprot:m.73700 g.73700  ORF g.73700 m.73700 type:complete len:422 (-) comp7737_c0_seq4:3-1268(-)
MRPHSIACSGDGSGSFLPLYLSRRKSDSTTAYVVSTTSMLCSSSTSRVRSPPWYTSTERASGVVCLWISARHCRRATVGQMTSVGRIGRLNSRAIVWIVLPIPMSSARIPPRNSELSSWWHIQATPSHWNGSSCGSSAAGCGAGGILGGSAPANADQTALISGCRRSTRSSTFSFFFLPSPRLARFFFGSAAAASSSSSALSEVSDAGGAAAFAPLRALPGLAAPLRPFGAGAAASSSLKSSATAAAAAATVDVALGAAAALGVRVASMGARRCVRLSSARALPAGFRSGTDVSSSLSSASLAVIGLRPRRAGAGPAAWPLCVGVPPRSLPGSATAARAAFALPLGGAGLAVRAGVAARARGVDCDCDCDCEPGRDCSKSESLEISSLSSCHDSLSEPLRAFLPARRAILSELVHERVNRF